MEFYLFLIMHGLYLQTTLNLKKDHWIKKESCFLQNTNWVNHLASLKSTVYNKQTALKI